MMGTVLRPERPAPAENDSNARPSENTEKMSRITLALLDEYALEGTSGGYDPYNTDAGRRAADIWRRKPKRD